MADTTPPELPPLPEGTPERIYLVLGTDDGIVPVPFSQLDEVTWCQDQIEDGDPEYVRADVMKRLLADERRKALTEAAQAADGAKDRSRNALVRSTATIIAGLIRELIDKEPT